MAIQKVTSDLIADDAVTAAKIANNTVTAAQLANNTITAAQLANNTVTAAQLANNSVGLTQLNLSDGTNGQFLKTDGSGTLAFADAGGGGGAWNVISSQTVSSSVTYVTFTGLTGYANYKLVWNSVRHVNHPTWMYFEVSTDGGSNWFTSTNWLSTMLYGDSATTSLSVDNSWSNSSGKCSIIRNIHQHNDYRRHAGEITFYSFNPSDWTHFESKDVHDFFAGRSAFTQCFGTCMSETGFNAIRFGAGNNFDRGTFTLYGLATS